MRKSLKGAASVAVLGIVLAGCSQPVLEAEVPGSSLQSGMQSGQQSMEPEPESGVTLTAEQISRIVADIQVDLDEAVDAKDPSIMERRVTKPAFTLRKGQFVRAEKTETEIPPLTINPQVFSATSGTSWPRVLLVASNASGDEPAEVFVITQEDAKADYQLENWSRLIGGTSVKGVSVQDGSKVLEADATGLLMTPEDVVTTYVNYLNSPDNEEYARFEDKVFSPRYREELKTVNEAVEVAGNVKATAKVGKTPPIGVSLDTGQALLSASFSYDMVYSRTVPGSSFEMAGTPAAYLEDKGVIGSVTVKYLVTVFFVVPPEGSDEDIAVVGSERVITSVDRDDTEPTEE